MPLHALELVPDEVGRDAVLRDWTVLRDAGLPSQLDHGIVVNTPHVTVVAAPLLTAEVTARAVELLAPLLPIRARASGLLLLGGPRVTVARALDVSDEVVRTVLALRAEVDGPQHASWLPHLTLARRVRRAEVGQAIELVGHDELVLSLTELRRWDPDSREVTPVVVAS
jgi:hypothetical protein